MRKKLLVLILTFLMVFGTIGSYANAEIFNTNQNAIKFFSNDKQEVTNFINSLNGIRLPQNAKQNGPLTNGLLTTSHSYNLVILSDGTDLTSQLNKIGTSKKVGDNIFTLDINENNLSKLLNVTGIKGISLDNIYNVDPKERNPINYVNKLPFKPDVESTEDDTNADKFYQMGYDGKGVTIAIIDTGVDPIHEMLQNADGDIKVIDWQDFTGEGDVSLNIETTVQSVYSDVYGSPAITIKPNVENKAYNDILNALKLTTINTVNQSVYGEVYNEVYKEVYIPDTGTYIKMPDVIPDGAKVYVGELHENIFPNEIYFGYRPGANTGFDFNRDGDKTDNYYVLGIDIDGNGSPDIVAVDTNQNNNIADDTPLIPYKDGIEKLNTPFVASFPNDPNVPEGAPPAKMNFVLTGIFKGDNGVYIANLGFPGGSHGTHVAGISTGSGSLRGLAPGAKVMALKALGTNVGGATSGIMAAMEYAAKNGADIVNMSLGSSPDINDGTSPESQLANELSKKYHIIFSISAGNEGPGINSIGAPGDSTEAITSGAYISHDTWLEYGYNVPGDGLWYFSSVGPREDGGLKPTIITPGSAISSVPEWDVWAGGQYRGPYDLYQGTSMAAPQTSGLSALLLSAARKDKLIGPNDRLDPELVSEALIKTARHIGDYAPVEEGGGLPDVVAAYDYIKNKLGATKDDIEVATDYKEKITNTTGVYVRNGNIPDTVNAYIKNDGSTDITLNISNSIGYISLDKSTLNIPAGQIGNVVLSIDKSKLQPGLNSGVITLDDPATKLIDGSIPVTIVVPTNLDKDSLYLSDTKGEVPVSHYTRHFYRVPDGVKSFKIDLTSLETEKGVGRIRATLFDPNGIEYNPNEILYTTPDTPTVTRSVYNPLPGVWEVNVYESFASSVPVAQYDLKFMLTGLVPKPDTWSESGEVGTNLEKQFSLTNLTDADQDVKYVGTGLVDLNTPPKVTHPVIDVNSDSDTDLFGHGYIEFFKVTKDNPNFVYEVSISDDNPADDLDLYLFKLNDDDKSLSQYAMDADGDSNESIKLKALPAGTYILDVNAFAVPSGKATVNLSKKALFASDAVKGSDMTVTGSETIKQNETGSMNAKMTIPETPSNYAGLIVVNDKDGNMLTRINVSVNALPKSVTLKNIVSDHEKVELNKGDTVQLKITANYSNGTTTDITNDATYVVKDSSIASVDKGLVKGLSKGETVLDITYGSVSTTVNIKVNEVSQPGGGGGGSTLPSSGGSTNPPSSGTGEIPTTGDNTSTESKTVKVPIDGASVETAAKDLSMTFADGTFNGEVTLKITPLKVEDINKTSNIKLIGSAYEIDTNGVQPSKPVKAVFKYDDKNLNGIDERLISVFTYKDGRWESVGGTVDTTNNTVTVNLTHFSEYALMAKDINFSDTASNWAKDDIKVLASRDIISGYEDNTFKPDKAVTRAEFISMLTRALAIDGNNANIPSFKDVKSSDWYYGAVEAAKQVGLTSGYEDGTFRPNAEISRQEMTAMIVNALRANKVAQFLPTGNAAELNKFRDNGKVQDWAKDSMAIGVINGLIQGTDSETLSPDGTSTRAMAAAMILRMLKQLGRI
ncbi:S8 family serine peptidase [Thermoanaerobacterium sp. RBIITD]|uniref:S8 family serine peptidase n=1 Tax=Thermoanaerobacterium sp. RBIITD TaxID=1550240 RepID=UPI000BB96A6B|nr:S8 family serine peptidase [Thermoanaerobacterium sp. RBIITD]SNX53601.1 S-layer homology domain-containing protein [Thermoanaerobacterium sp. RBIITD]